MTITTKFTKLVAKSIVTLRLSISQNVLSSTKIKKKSSTLGRVHSGIRVHLTLRGRNSPYIHPIGTKCTSNAFFFHAEDGKNIFLSLLHFGGGKLATPPPLATIDRFRNKGQRWFSLLWRTFAVRRQTRTP